MNENIAVGIKEIVQSAAIAALLLAGQVALRVIPNVEIVTVVIIVSAFVFRARVTVLSAIVFCTGQWFIYGFGYWVVAYYIYWPLLAFVSLSLKLCKNKAVCNILAVILAVVLTSFFGVLTTATDVIMSGLSRDFFTFFVVIYVRGVYFYITHIVSNAVIVALLFSPLAKILVKFKVPPPTQS